MAPAKETVIASTRDRDRCRDIPQEHVRRSRSRQVRALSRDSPLRQNSESLESTTDIRDEGMAASAPGTAAARVAGLCYIAVILLGVAQTALVSSRLPALDDAEAVVAVLIDQSLRFRLGALGDILLYTLVLVLVVALYIVVRDVHRPLALGGLVLRSAEAVVGLAVTVVGGVAPLLLLSQATDTDPHSIVALLAARESALDAILMLVGLGGAAFCHLFFVSRLVPRALALWGVLTYVSMLVLGASRILLPSLPSLIAGVLFGQGALFELVFGLWLVAKAQEIASRARVAPAAGAS